jgi:iron complex outermembrane receptor protein
MKKCYTIILFSLISIAVNARHSVSGIVTGFRDSAVAGVTVYIPEFEKTDETKAGGTYIIRDIGKGRVHIQFSKPGYKTIVQLINTDDSALVVNVKMELTLTTPEEFTSISGNPSLSANEPFAVSTFSANTYRQSGATGILSAMATQPGIDRMSVGNGISKPVIRGLSLGRIQVREFGTAIGDQAWNEMHDIGISENGVEHVEVIKGPAALMYGADAMGGVLIFEEQKPAAAGTILGDVGLGIHSNPIGLEGELGFKGATTSGIFYSVRGGVESHTSYIQGLEADEVQKNTEAKAFATNSKWGNENTKVSIGLSKNWGVSKLSYSYLHQMIGIITQTEEDSYHTAGEQTDKQRERTYHAPYQDVSRNLVSSENTIITGKSSVKINLAYQFTDRQEFEKDLTSDEEDAKELLNSNSLSTITYDVRWTSDPSKKFGFVIGSQGFMQKNDLKRTESLILHNNKINDFGGYALVRYGLDKVNLFGGIRYDLRKEEFLYPLETIYGPDLEPDYTPINGSIGIAYHPIKNFTLKLNGATGYTTPNEMQLGSALRIPTYGSNTDYLGHTHYRYEEGNIDLKMEHNTEVDLGFIYSSPHVDINLSGYYNMIGDYIFLQSTGITDTVTDSLEYLYDVYTYQQDDAAISGGEVMFDIHPAPLKWFDLQLGYSMVDGKFDGGGNVPYIPADKFTAALTVHAKKLMWFFNPYVTVAATNYVAQKDTAAFELVSESYTLFDLRIGLQLPFAHQYVDLNLSVNNLLNTPYMSYLSQVRYIGVRDMGRNVSIRIRIPFGVMGFSR